MHLLSSAVLIITCCTAIVYSIPCNVALGSTQGALLYTIPVSKVSTQPEVMTIEFNYRRNPIDPQLHITRVVINADAVECGNIRIETVPTLPEGFIVRMTSAGPITQMSGTAAVYGIRYA